MPGAGCQIPDARCQMPDARVPGAGCRVPGDGYRVPDARVRGAGCRVPERKRSAVSGQPESAGHGSRLTAHGSRLTAHSSRLTAHGSQLLPSRRGQGHRRRDAGDCRRGYQGGAGGHHVVDQDRPDWNRDASGEAGKASRLPHRPGAAVHPHRCHQCRDDGQSGDGAQRSRQFECGVDPIAPAPQTHPRHRHQGCGSVGDQRRQEHPEPPRRRRPVLEPMHHGPGRVLVDEGRPDQDSPDPSRRRRTQPGGTPGTHRVRTDRTATQAPHGAQGTGRRRHGGRCLPAD